MDISYMKRFTLLAASNDRVLILRSKQSPKKLANIRLSTEILCTSFPIINAAKLFTYPYAVVFLKKKRRHNYIKRFNKQPVLNNIIMFYKLT
jgi:hypothetical protein